MRAISRQAHGGSSTRLSFETNPEPTDQTIETTDLKIFVAQELVEPLTDRVLDVKATHQGLSLTFL